MLEAVEGAHQVSGMKYKRRNKVKSELVDVCVKHIVAGHQCQGNIHSQEMLSAIVTAGGPRNCG